MRFVAKPICMAMFAVLPPIVGGAIIYFGNTNAILVLSAPWLNWAIYIIGFLSAAVVTAIGSRVMKSRSMLILAVAYIYWALGCIIGSMQTGENSPIDAQHALPYIRMLWLLGSTTIVIASVLVAMKVVRVVPGTGNGGKNGKQAECIPESAATGGPVRLNSMNER